MLGEPSPLWPCRGARRALLVWRDGLLGVPLGMAQARLGLGARLSSPGTTYTGLCLLPGGMLPVTRGHQTSTWGPRTQHCPGPAPPWRPMSPPCGWALPACSTPGRCPVPPGSAFRQGCCRQRSLTLAGTQGLRRCAGGLQTQPPRTAPGQAARLPRPTARPLHGTALWAWVFPRTSVRW